MPKLRKLFVDEKVLALLYIQMAIDYHLRNGTCTKEKVIHSASQFGHYPLGHGKEIEKLCHTLTDTLWPILGLEE